ncbi:ABC transporter substrate-binding protein [Paraclostridium ghonii]|uniref:ABC transporter substrate-binding protein n=1 Tax=Paraclostridium ghonii TaxID=29358 RepID=UPI00202D064B|nr:ABC transporter substrate-binding protein [Paeniclostridium ghonii]MCM0166929.1 ABC transporter substrate-binding protein [Paeniclostridium ghonii]
MRKIRKSISIMMIAIFVITMVTGCGSGKKITKGGYIGTDLKLPEGMKAVTGIGTLDNGDIAVIGFGEDLKNQLYYTSSDNGKSWNDKKIKTPELPEGSNIISSNIKGDGSVLIVYEIQLQENLDTKQTDREASPENPEKKAVLIDTSGNSTEVAIDKELLNRSGELKVDNNGDIYLQDYEKNKIVRLDGKTGTVKKEYKYEMQDTINWAVNGNYLLVASPEKAIEFDTESGENKGEVNIEKEIIAANPGIYPGKDKDTFYFINRDGIYVHKIGSKSQEKIMDGSRSGVGSNYVYQFIQKSEDEFMILLQTNEGETILKNYKYDADMVVDDKKEISIFSMYDSDRMRQAIAMYQKKHPDVHINLEIGIDNNQSITKTDAIKKVNTEIMAGKGPDIIMLDGLPAKSYMEKGLLEDITDIVEGDDAVLSNIVKASKSADGKIYSAPLKFHVPVIIGENASNINTLSSLGKSIEDISKNAKGSVMDVFSPEELVYLLYNQSGASWINTDNTINTKNLNSFLVDTKKIYDSIKDKNSTEKIKQHEETLKYSEEYEPDKTRGERFIENSGDFTQLLNENPTSLCMYNFSSINDLSIIETIKEVNGNISYDIWKGQGTSSLVGLDTIAINSKSSKKDISKDFVKMLFSEEYQSIDKEVGFPVNKAAFKASFTQDKSRYGETIVGGDIEIKLKEISQDEVDSLMKKIESIDTMRDPDIEVLRKTIDEFNAYILGEKSLDETVKAIQNKLEIYLSE